MKLFRHGAEGREKPGAILPSGRRIDVSSFGSDYNEAFFHENGLARLADWLRKNADACPDAPAGARIASCVARPSKIICIGLNYVDHARETGAEIPKEPVIFFKSTTSLCGPCDDLWIPRDATKVDWEVELAFVISKKAKYVAPECAMEHVAGFAAHNDYSERHFQLERGGQWVKGKSCDTFAPLGPWLATPDEIVDFRNLKMWLKVNDRIRQNSNTSNMIFDIPALVSYLSRFMTLLPGDVVSTGTPPGVGLGQNPPVYLNVGDVVEYEIEGLGRGRQKAVREPL
ncbi:MAG: fumarylacetoacetate hydrolase family protein [Planctomycetes bacterium]|nr:fumarylacetoacetate hydrolase family protein [Planctomycetota bacterium]